MKIKLPKIEFRDFINCFSLKRDHRYKYIGIYWNIFSEGSENHKLLEEFIKYMAKQVRPKLCPWFIMNLLHLFGNDNSICRVRNFKVYNLKMKLAKGIMITDIKTKYGTLRIYGYFTKEINDKIKELTDKINPTLEEY